MYEPPSELSDISEVGLANICELLGVPCENFQKINDSWLNIQRERWLAVLKKKGRVPFIWYPNVCARCGKLGPLLFMVPKEEWNRYVQPDVRDKVLCRACYDEIKALIDTGKKKRQEANKK